MLNGFSLNRAGRPIRYRAARALGTLFIAFGCADGPTDPLAPAADARLDGLLGASPYSARAMARIKRTPGAQDSLYIYASRRFPVASERETVRIRVAFSGVGTYLLGDSTVTLTQTIGGDGLMELYSGSRPSPGALSITTLGAPGDLVIGSVRFWLAPSRHSPPETAPMEFTEGTFTIRLGEPTDSPQLLRDLRAPNGVNSRGHR